jgi:aspartokinase/homoserine dehydrogenase 1
MTILKFGGTSLESAASIEAVLTIINNKRISNSTGIVVSAISGITNLLQNSVQKCLHNTPIQEMTDEFKDRHQKLFNELKIQYPSCSLKDLENFLEQNTTILSDSLSMIRQNKSCPLDLYCQILSLGELISAQLITTLLANQGKKVLLLHPENFIKTRGPLDQADPIVSKVVRRFDRLLNNTYDCLIMAGFIGSCFETNKLSLLGRNSSDYSATLMAVGLKASSCEIWSDVDGLFTKDPNVENDALHISRLSYEEALLSYQQAKVIHPKAVQLLAEFKIPLYLKNTFNPTHPGTKIYNLVD